jgi:hypothetical protein
MGAGDPDRLPAVIGHGRKATSHRYSANSPYERARKVLHAILLDGGTLAAPTLISAEPLPIPAFSGGRTVLAEINIRAKEAWKRLMAAGCHDQTIIATSCLLTAPKSYWTWVRKSGTVAYWKRDIAILTQAATTAEALVSFLGDDKNLRIHSLEGAALSGVECRTIIDAVSELRNLASHVSKLIPQINEDLAKRIERHVAALLLSEHIKSRAAAKLTDAVDVITGISRDSAISPDGESVTRTAISQAIAQVREREFCDCPRSQSTILGQLQTPPNLAEWMIESIPPEFREYFLLPPSENPTE